MRYKQNNGKPVIRQGKFTILGFQQIQLVKYGFDVKLAFILRYLIDFESSKSSKIKRWYFNETEKTDAADSCFYFDNDGNTQLLDDVYRYTWLFHDKILLDLPILDIKKRQLRRYLTTLEGIGMIKTIVVRGRFSYYRTIKNNIEKLYDKYPINTVHILDTGSKTVKNDNHYQYDKSRTTGDGCHSRQTKDTSYNHSSHNDIYPSHNEVTAEPVTCDDFILEDAVTEVFNEIGN